MGIRYGISEGDVFTLYDFHSINSTNGNIDRSIDILIHLITVGFVEELEYGKVFKWKS